MAGWSGDASDGLSQALCVLYAGLDMIDRDLDVGAGRIAQRVGVENDGRLLLAIESDGEGDAPVLAALDALAFHQRHRAVLSEHFEHPRLDPDLEPRVALIAARFSETLLARLAPITSERLCCYELRTVRSGRGERTYLVPVEPGPERTLGSDPDGRRALLRALESGDSALAEELLRRIERVDEGLEARRADGGVAWSFEGEELCALRAEQGELRARVGPRGPFSAVAGEDAAEFLLEELMQHFRDRLALVDPDAPLPGIASRLDPDAPILTQEEIAAFREP